MFHRFAFIIGFILLSSCKIFTESPEAKEARFSTMSVCNQLNDNGLCEIDESDLVGAKKISVSVYFMRTQSLQKMILILMNGDKEVQRSPIIIVNKNESAYSFMNDTDFPRGKYTVLLEVSGVGYDDFKTSKDFTITSNINVNRLLICESLTPDTKNCSSGLSTIANGAKELFVTTYFSAKTIDEQWYVWFRPSSSNLTTDHNLAEKFTLKTESQAISQEVLTQKINLNQGLAAGSYEILVMQFVTGQLKHSQIFKHQITVK